MTYYVLVNKIDGYESPCIFLTKVEAENHAKEMQEEYWDIIERNR